MRSLRYVTESDKERFWSKAVIKDGCWEWTGAIRAKGYAAAYSQHLQREIGAHRISWVIHNGPIPDGLFVCHH